MTLDRSAAHLTDTLALAKFFDLLNRFEPIDSITFGIVPYCFGCCNRKTKFFENNSRFIYPLLLAGFCLFWLNLCIFGFTAWPVLRFLLPALPVIRCFSIWSITLFLTYDSSHKCYAENRKTYLAFVVGQARPITACAPTYSFSFFASLLFSF